MGEVSDGGNQSITTAHVTLGTGNLEAYAWESNVLWCEPFQSKNPRFVVILHDLFHWQFALSDSLCHNWNLSF